MPALFRSLPLILAILVLAPFASAQTMSAPSAPAAASNTDLTSPVQAARLKIASAVKKMNANPSDIDGALADLTQAIRLKPDSAFAYLLRGSLYTQKKMFPEAEADFNVAYKMDPNNVVIRFNLSELKFMQKHYDEARTGFLPLEKDTDMGDFAMYKVFLCDLFAGHMDVAKSELDALDKKGDDASYYFAHAAWDLNHKNIESARNWLISASHIYQPKKFTMYGESLRYVGYLPLPQPKDGAAGTTP